MFEPTTNTDEKLMLLANKLYLLSAQRSSMEINSFMSAFIPDKPVMEPLSDIWLTHNGCEKVYHELLNMYFDKKGAPADDKTVQKHYPNYDRNRSESLFYAIGPKGKPDIIPRRHEQYHYSYTDATVDYKELNTVKDQIIAARRKIFKSKGTIQKLSEQHKQLRKSMGKTCAKLPQVALDKVFLKTFSHKKFDSTIDSGSVTQNLFLTTVGWICLPPFFFNDSLYDCKKKNYQNYNVTTYINLLPEASLALITKDLQAESGNAFFKKGVSVSDVLQAVKKQAEYERKFAQKFTLEFACSLLNEKLKDFHPDPRKTTQTLTIKLPYMGLDKFDDKGLSSVADQIFNYYSLFEQYEKYAKWFENYPMAKYRKAVSEYSSHGTVADWEKRAAAVLPNGYKDLPYFDLYMKALDTNNFHTYDSLCHHINEIRRRDEMDATIKQIARTQQTLVKQNNTIIHNQQKLHEQNERHHKNEMSAYNSVMRKLDDIQDSLDQEIVIYW